MPAGAMAPGGVLETVVEEALKKDFANVHLKFLNNTPADRLASHRAGSSRATLSPKLLTHFIEDWLTPMYSNGAPKSFPDIPADTIRQRIEQGFKKAVDDAASHGSTKFTCRWVDSGSDTIFEVFSGVSSSRNHVAIVLVTPPPR